MLALLSGSVIFYLYLQSASISQDAVFRAVVPQDIMKLPQDAGRIRRGTGLES